MKTPSDDIDRFYYYGINPRTRVLWIGGIGDSDYGSDEAVFDDPGIYWNTARRLIMGLSILDQDAKGNAPVTIIMNSCGGDWSHGMAMYDAITKCRQHVTIVNMSHARSMSSLIFQAGDLRITAPHGYYMIHDGEEGVFGIPKSVESWVEYTKQHVNPQMYSIYLGRLQEGQEDGTPKVDIKEAAEILNSKMPKGASPIRKTKGVMGITQDHIAQLCSKDTFFTPEEMIKLNFADRYLEAGDLAGAYANPDMHGLPTGLPSLKEDEAE